MFADFALTYVVMIDESLPHALFKRRGFVKSRTLLLFFWLFVGNVLSMGYRSTLLSTLIPIRDKLVHMMSAIFSGSFGLT